MPHALMPHALAAQPSTAVRTLVPLNDGWYRHTTPTMRLTLYSNIDATFTRVAP
jgi:hypothetical protein